MTRWFRFYADAMRNPKVAGLSDAEFRLWLELLAVASENDGHIPPAETLKHVLKRRLDHLSRGLEGLLRASLIDALGDGYAPHNWSKRQYKSDTSTERVREFRGKRNVSVTPPETETDTDSSVAKATSPRARRAKPIQVPKPDNVSDTVWRDFTDHRKRKGGPVSETALDGFEREAAKAGWTLEAALIETVERNWQGFKATWVTGRDDNGRNQNIRADRRNSLTIAADEAIAALGP